MGLTIGDVLAIPSVGRLNAGTLKPSRVAGVSTDSRVIRRGDVFFAIRGEKFDGHRFILNAFEKGASLAVVDERCDVAVHGSKPLLLVRDTVASLGELAARYRREFDIPIIAVAGSNGKTTTKDMMAQVLKRRFAVLSTQGNLNNQIGVPLTLFQLKKRHEIAVVELGTNHFGEIRSLCRIVQPTHGLITNVGREHLEFLVDSKGVATEEGALFDFLGTTGTGFVNVDDRWVVRRSKVLKRKVTYAFSRAGVHVQGKFLGLDRMARGLFSVKAKRKREFLVRLSAPGEHLVGNALAAASVGLFFKVPAAAIQRALGRFRPASKRMEVHTLGGVTIIDDTYNANPDSMLAALETLKAMDSRGRKIAVLGDMLELGKKSEVEHRRVGSAAADSAEYLLTYGSNARYIHDASAVRMKFHFDQKNVLSEYLAELAAPGDIVLVKGSRGMLMEDVVRFLLTRGKGVPDLPGVER